jgi:hypothetical protein
VKTGADVTTRQYLLEWLRQFSSPYPGMTLDIVDGKFQVWLSPWMDIAPVAPLTWYYFAVSKGPGKIEVFVNGLKPWEGTSPNLGPQFSEIVVGGSTFRGPGVYGDLFRGSVGQLCIWKRALIDPEVQEAYHQDSTTFISRGSADVPMDARPLVLASEPNPFRSRWTLDFSLPEWGDVELSIYSVNGRRVRQLANGPRQGGPQRFVWDGRDETGRELPPGVYYARLTTPQGHAVRRVVHLR